MPPANKKTSINRLLPELMRLESALDRRKFLSRHLIFVRPKVVQRLALVVVKRIRVDAREALRLAEQNVLSQSIST
jgi:hypothetical protein